MSENRSIEKKIVVLAIHPAEARLVNRIWRRVLGERLHIIVCGGRADVIRDAIEKAAKLKPECFVSVGLASALVAGLAEQNLLVAGSIILPTGDLVPVSSSLLHRAGAYFKDLKPWQGPVAGVDRLPANVPEKNSLHAATAAWAADCVCAVAVLAARKQDVPFMAIRGILDRTNMVLPRVIRTVWQQGVPAWLMAMIWCVLPHWWWRYRCGLKGLEAGLLALAPMWNGSETAAQLPQSSPAFMHRG